MSNLVADNNKFIAYPEAPNSRANRVKFQANESKVPAPNGISRIRIPHNRLSYIDTTQSWIHATPTTTVNGVGLTTAELAINNLGIESLVSAIRVFCGNRLINEVTSYNQVAAALQVSNTGAPNSFGNSVTSGAAINSRQWSGGRILKPDEYYAPKTDDTKLVIDENAQGGLTFNLLGLMGAGNPKMLPIGELSSDIEIQITWASPWDMYYENSQLELPNSGATTPVVGRLIQSMTTEVTNVWYDAHIITVSEAVNTEIQKRSRDENGIMSWSGALWSADCKINLTGTLLKNGAQINNILSGFRYKSLKNILCTGFPPNNVEQPYIDDGTGTVGTLTGHRGNVPMIPYGFWGKNQQVRYNIAGRYYPQEYLATTSEVVAGTNEVFSNHYNGTTNNVFSHFGTDYDQRLYFNTVVGPDSNTSTGTITGITQYNNINIRQTQVDASAYTGTTTGGGNNVTPVYAKPFKSNPATVSIVPLEDSEISGNSGIDTTDIQVVLQSKVDGVNTAGFNNEDCNLDAVVMANYDCLYSINKDGLLSVSY